MTLLSIPRIAKKVGGSDSLVRRYISRFPEFFHGKTYKGVKKFPEETVRLVDRIKKLYRSPDFKQRSYRKYAQFV